MKLRMLITLLYATFVTCSPAIVTPTEVDTYEYNELCPNDLRRKWFDLIVPGTKWCGLGDIADSPDDLGHFAETDACCQKHDYCNNTIAAGQTKYNLTNPTFYTRLHCSCDEIFYDCLHRSGDHASRYVGWMYFTELNTKCYRQDYPIVRCRRALKWPKRCLEYELDESRPKIYQWFDVPVY